MDHDSKKSVDLLSMFDEDPSFGLKVRAEECVLEFVGAVQEHLRSRGVKQAELARTVGVKRSQMTRWLTGETGFNAKTLFLLALGLGYELEISWRETEEQSTPETPETPEEDSSTSCAMSNAASATVLSLNRRIGVLR